MLCAVSIRQADAPRARHGMIGVLKEFIASVSAGGDSRLVLLRDRSRVCVKEEALQSCCTTCDAL